MDEGAFLFGRVRCWVWRVFNDVFLIFVGMGWDMMVPFRKKGWCIINRKMPESWGIDN